MSASRITHAKLAAGGDVLSCQINPESLRRTKSVRWTADSTRSGNQPRPQYVGPGSEQLSASLLFDNRKAGAPPRVTWTSIGTILTWLTVPESAQSKQTPQPPKVTFSWGGDGGLDFRGYLTSATVQYQIFSPSGEPLRATVAIVIQAAPDDPQGTNPTSGGVSGRASAEVGESDTLASLAYEHYGDPNLWRAIAIVNGVEYPGRVPLGERLLLPPRSEAMELSRPRPMEPVDA